MRRNGLLVAGGVLAVAVALSLSGTLVWLRSARVQQARATVEVRQQTTPSAEPAATPGEPGPKPAEESVRPSFDLARVEPSGEAVFAGRARPGAAVELADN